MFFIRDLYENIFNAAPRAVMNKAAQPGIELELLLLPMLSSSTTAHFRVLRLTLQRVEGEQKALITAKLAGTIHVLPSPVPHRTS